MVAGIKKLLSNKTVRVLLVCLAALLLLVAVRLVFFRGEGKETGYVPTEREARLSQILSEVEGVESATVMIAEEEGKAVSAVVVFSGADSALTRSRVLDITSAALQIKKDRVQVYPAEK